MKHGYNAYTTGCRCDVCRTAKAAYMRQKRAAASQNRDLARAEGRVYVAPDIGHGLSGYTDSKCRCDICWRAKKRAKFYQARALARRAKAVAA